VSPFGRSNSPDEPTAAYRTYLLFPDNVNNVDELRIEILSRRWSSKQAWFTHVRRRTPTPPFESPVFLNGAINFMTNNRNLLFTKLQRRCKNNELKTTRALWHFLEYTYWRCIGDPIQAVIIEGWSENRRRIYSPRAWFLVECSRGIPAASGSYLWVGTFATQSIKCDVMT